MVALDFYEPRAVRAMQSRAKLRLILNAPNDSLLLTLNVRNYPAAPVGIELDDIPASGTFSAENTWSIFVDRITPSQSSKACESLSPLRTEFLNKVYKLDATEPQEAIDVIVDKLDDLQNSSDFDEVDAILIDAVPAKLSAPSIVSVLGITLAAKGLLDSRKIFYSRAVRAVAQQRGSKEAAEKLLRKYL